VGDTSSIQPENRIRFGRACVVSIRLGCPIAGIAAAYDAVATPAFAAAATPADVGVAAAAAHARGLVAPHENNKNK
jgi:hypothetical protein